MEIRGEDDAVFLEVFDGDTEIGVFVPQALTLSLYHDMSESRQWQLQLLAAERAGTIPEEIKVKGFSELRAHNEPTRTEWQRPIRK